MLTKLGRRMDEHSQSFNKKIENIRKYKIEVTELKNTMTKLKNKVQRFESRLNEAGDRISKLEYRQWNSPIRVTAATKKNF